MCLKALKAQQIRVQLVLCAVNKRLASLNRVAFAPVAALPHKIANRIEDGHDLSYLRPAFQRSHPPEA
jgi:hypothetical protein